MLEMPYNGGIEMSPLEFDWLISKYLIVNGAMKGDRRVNGPTTNIS